MERSGLIAIILAVVMLLAGGWFTYDGMQKNDDMLKKVATAQAELDTKTKAAVSLEKKVTGLSGIIGFNESANWLNRQAFLDLWNEEIKGDADLTKALEANGVKTSEKLGQSEIALAISLTMQLDKPTWFEQARIRVQGKLDAKVEELRAKMFDQPLTKKGPEGADVPVNDAEWARIQADKDAGLYALRTGPRPWTNPEAMRANMNSWGKRMANIKDEAKKVAEAAKTPEDKAWWNVGAKAASGAGLDSFAEATADKKPAVTDARRLLDGLDALIVAISKQIDDTRKARDDARANLHAIIGETDAEGKKVKPGSMSDEEAKKDTSIKELQTTLTDLRGKITQAIKDGEAALAALNKDITDETIKLNGMVKEKTTKIKELESKLSDTKERLAKLQARQSAVVETTKSDGQFLTVDVEHGVGWVDLGRSNTLFKGTRFEIFRLLKAGKRQAIGEMEVLELGDVRSRVAITKVLNPADPPVAGDLISNSAFDRKKPRVFSFAGQLKYKYSRDDLRRRLIEWGAAVSDDCGPSTNTLIVGDRYTEDPNWAKAMEIGTPIMRERELYDSLGIE